MARTYKNNYMPADYGKAPPQDIEIEEAVLGALILEPDSVIEVYELIKRPEVFYKEANQIIAAAIIWLYDDNKDIDLLTVNDFLRKNDSLDVVGGPFYISGLMKRIGTAVHITEHCRILFEKYISRELIRIGSEVMNRACDESTDPSDLIDFAGTEIFKISFGVISGIKHIKEISLGNLNELSKPLHNGLLGISSGIREIDKALHGFQNPDFIIIAARPGIGKTSIALQFAVNIAVWDNIPVGFFTLEMSSGQCEMRMKSNISDIGSETLKSREFSDGQYRAIEQATLKISSSPMYFDDTPAIDVNEFRTKATRMVHKHGVKIIFLDYIQLMSPGKKVRHNREQDVSEISRGIKAVAKKLDVPIIGLSQLSREKERRASGNYKLSDLRDSGSLEQDADVVVFIDRPWEEGIVEDMGRSTYNLCNFIVKKYRNGKKGNYPIHYEPGTFKFTDMPKSDYEFLVNTSNENIF